jgi:hypothetical protein
MLFVDTILDMLSRFALSVHFYNCAANEATYMADPLPYPGAPRWVKVSGIAVIVLATLVVILIHVGGGNHMLSAGGHGNHAAPQSGH